MPRHKNNYNRPKNGRVITNSSSASEPNFAPCLHPNSNPLIGGNMIDSGFTDDSRSLEEKVNDLSDIFVGDYHVDRDVIEAVLDGCDGNVNNATDKLSEIITTAFKAKNRLKRSEENDLAVIACSILSQESNSSTREEQSRTCEYSADTRFLNNQRSHLESNQSFTSETANSYNFHTNSIENKPQSDAKLLFKPDTSSQTFLTKNSFEDMARNMDCSAFVGSKMTERPLSKEEDYFSHASGKNRNIPPEKFKISENPLCTLPGRVRNISALNDDSKNKNSLLNTIDLSSNPVASLVNNNISPNVSEKWNAFYKELNLQPISESSVNTDLDISRIVTHFGAKDYKKIKVSSKNGKNAGLVSTEYANNPNELSNFLKELCNLSGSDTFISHGGEGNSEIESARGKLSESSSNHSVSSILSHGSDDSASSPNGPQSVKMVKEENNESTRHPFLSANAAPFIPSMTTLSKASQDGNLSKEVSPTPRPIKPLKTHTNKILRTTIAGNRQPLNRSLHELENVQKKTFAQEFAVDASQNLIDGHRSPRTDSDTRAHDPFGWEEINSIISTSLSSSKSQTQQIRKACTPASKTRPTNLAMNIHMQRTQVQSNQSLKNFEEAPEASLTSKKPMAFSARKTPISASYDSSESFSQSQLTKSTSSTGETAIQKELPFSDCHSKSSSLKLPPSLNVRQAPPQHQTVHPPQTRSLKVLPPPPSLAKEPLPQTMQLPPPSRAKKPPSSAMQPPPPSLAKKPSSLPPSSPLICPVPLNPLPKKHPQTIHKALNPLSSLPIFSNKVELVGVKTPRGILRHYLQEKHPVMVILRGLPGSGKSYLARELMAEIKEANQAGVVLSTDDYFFQAGQYIFNRNDLDVAHEWNKKRALTSLKNNQPYIIIDNTNLQMWELLPYAEMAIQHNFDVRICEPDTHWKNKVHELSRKNEHGLAKEHIKRMKERYEPWTTEQVIQQACKSLIARGKSTHFKQDGNKKDVHFSKSKIEELNSIDENTLKPSIVQLQQLQHVECSKVDGTTSSSPQDLKLTQWTASHDQRNPNKRGEKALMLNKHDGPLPQSQNSQISLEYLNNSLKRAMKDIDPFKRESVSNLGDSHKPGLKEEVSTETRPLSHTSCAKLANREDIINAPVLIHDNSKMDSRVQSEISSFHEVDVNIEAKNENVCEKVIPIDYFQMEFIVDTEQQDDPNKDDQSIPLTRTLISPVSLQNEQLSQKSSQNEDYFSPGLESSGASSSFHSCKSDADKAEVEDQDGFGCDLSTPITVVDAIEFASRSALDSLDLDTTKRAVHVCSNESKTTQPNSSFVQEGEDDQDVSDFKSKIEQTNELIPPYSNIDNVGYMVRKLPSFTGSLVQYDDSEESDEQCLKPSSRVVASRGLVVQTEKTTDYASSEKIETNASLNGRTINPSLKETSTSSCNDDGDESPIDSEITSINDVAYESLALSSRDKNPPHPSSDFSSVKKAKKKRIRKGRNPEPFLEDSLVTESKSNDWHSFTTESLTVDSSIPDLEDEVVATLEKRVASVEMISESVQCEPYYFTMVHRLNSSAFSQEPVDLSVCDVSVINVSDRREIAHDTADDNSIQTIKLKHPNICDRSTMTDDSQFAEVIDLYILQDCFPMYSQKYLDDVMSVCGNNLEWVTNFLIDSPPLLDIDNGMENVSTDRGADNQQHEDAPYTSAPILSLARLSQEVVKNIAQVDSDDLELQVIKAGQMRLHLIENFGKERLHSVSHDNVTPDWSGSFKYNYFSGPLTPEECWEWNPNQEATTQGFGTKPIFPLSPSSPSDLTDSKFHSSSSPLYLPGSSQTKSPVTNFIPVMPPKENRSPLGLPSIEVDQRARLNRDLTIKAKQGQQQQLQSKLDLWRDKDDDDVMPTVPILPFSFIRYLENQYGPLGLELNSQGLILEDRIARKVFNCLKLQNKPLKTFNNDEQLKEDEKLARELQEEENARMMTSDSSNLASDQPSEIPLAHVTRHCDSAPHMKVTSVSDTLHLLRGTSSRQLKPYKFMARSRRSPVQLNSVWINQAKNKSPSNLHAIIAEEEAREESNKKKLQILRATGDGDALATKLKRQNLFSKYPLVEPDLLEDIFMNHGYSMEATMNALEYKYDLKPVSQGSQMDTDELIQKAKRQSLMTHNGLYVNPYNADETGEEFQRWPEDSEDIGYEDLRKEAQIYSDLAKECQQKAQQHNQDGMPSAALFYRQKAKEYKQNEQSSNQRAASFLFDRGSERLQRENTLDLHQFHIDEAIKAVNTALSLKRNEYNQRPDRRNSYLYVITGRGKNSKGGVPRLKPAVIKHLQDRNLSCEEKTAGMLKVYVFPRD